MKKLMATIFALASVSAFAVNDNFTEVEILVDLVGENQLIITDSDAGNNHLSKVTIDHGTIRQSDSIEGTITAYSEDLFLKRINSSSLLISDSNEIKFYFNDDPIKETHVKTLTGTPGSNNTLDTELSVKQGGFNADKNLFSFTVQSELFRDLSDAVPDNYRGTATLNVTISN